MGPKEQPCPLECLEQGESGVKAGTFQMFALRGPHRARDRFILKEGGISRHSRAAGAALSSSLGNINA